MRTVVALERLELLGLNHLGWGQGREVEGGDQTWVGKFKDHLRVVRRWSSANPSPPP